MPARKPASLKRQAGRPRKELNAKQVEKLAGLFLTHEEIAAVLGCSADTLTRNFAESLKKGAERGKSSLKRAQFLAAKAGNATMLVWLGKQHLGQRDRTEATVEHTGKDGTPLAMTVTFVGAK